MTMKEVMITAFWEWSTAFVELIPVIIGVRIVFQWIADLLFTRA